MITDRTHQPAAVRSAEPLPSGAVTRSTRIDLWTPTQACGSLAIDELALLDMVNSGRLAAYRIGGHVRFKVDDVRAVASPVSVT